MLVAKLVICLSLWAVAILAAGSFFIGIKNWGNAVPKIDRAIDPAFAGFFVRFWIALSGAAAVCFGKAALELWSHPFKAMVTAAVPFVVGIAGFALRAMAQRRA